MKSGWQQSLKALALMVLMLWAGIAKATDRPAVHGMLIFGSGPIYFSHLPMFHSPHDYQVIFEVDLPSSAVQTFLADQKAHPEVAFYTFVPKPMVLPTVIKSQLPFSGDLYRGHFENNGVLIQSDIPVKIKNVVYFNQFDPNATRPAQLTYLLCGPSGNQWLAHLISLKPDFDQVIAVESDVSVSAGHFLQLQIAGASPTSPLQDNTNPQAAVGRRTIQLKNLKTQYLEFDDLAM